jgi:hypothetical protein
MRFVYVIWGYWLLVLLINGILDISVNKIFRTIYPSAIHLNMNINDIERKYFAANWFEVAAFYIFKIPQ